MNEVSSRRRLAGRGLVAAALVALPLTATISYAASDAPMAPPAPPAAPAAPIAPAVPVPPAPPAPPAPIALQATGEVEVDEHEEFVVREVVKDKDGKETKTVERKIVIKDKDGKLSKEEREALRKELRQEFVEMDTEIEEAMDEVRVAMLELKDEKHGVTKVKIKCKDGSKGVALQGPEGETVHRLCTSEIMAHALTGLKEARKAIASDSNMDGEMRAEVLQALDEKIANWRAKGG